MSIDQAGGADLPKTLGERLWRWRDRLLANPKMQNLAVALPFLRPVANRRARELFDLCIGFVHTQVVTACIELGVLDMLAEKPMTVAEVAARTRLEADPAERLLRAACSLKLVVQNRNGRFRLGELGAAIRGAPGVREIVKHNQVFYRDLQDPVALLRGEREATELAQYWPYAEGDAAVSKLPAETTSPYTALMAASQPFIADDVIAAYDFRKHSALLDVGGGDGTFVSSVGAANPALKIGVFDLPSVADEATRKFAGLGLGDRATAFGGDFHRDALPTGFDAISLVRILLDHDDDTACRILTAARQALPPGGCVIVAELMSGAPGAETISDAYFGLYLFAMGRGRPRSAEGIRALMIEAGLTEIRAVNTRRALMTQLVVGRVPSN